MKIARTQIPRGGSGRAIAIGLALAVVACVGGWLYQRARVRAFVVANVPDPREAIAVGSPAFAERLRELDRRARDGPDPLGAAAELARLYDANWRSAEALSLYRRLAEREPREPRWPHATGVLLGAAGDLAGARDAFERTVVLAPRYLPARLRLAEVCLKSGDRDAARRCYAEALRLEAGQPQALLGLARLAADDGALARRHLEELLAAHPEFESAWTMLAALHEAAGRTDAASEARAKAAAGNRLAETLDDPWDTALLDECYDPYRLRVAASAAATGGRLDQAKRLIEQAVRFAPDSAAVQRERGRIWQAAGDWRRAKESFAVAVKLEPAFADNWANLQQACLHLGDPAGAAEALEAGLRACPDSPGLHLASARRYAATARPTEAIREFRASIRLRPQEAAARVELAAVLFQREQVAEGITELQAALAAEPEHPLALSTLAFVHIGLGEEEAARRWLARARAQVRLPRADVELLDRRFREQFGRTP